MSSLSERVIGSAVIAFVSTTIDDFAVMIIFFGKASANPNLLNNGGYTKVAVGQMLGFTVVVVVSLIGLGIGAAVPPGYVGLIGFIPILLGAKALIELIHEIYFSKKEAKGTHHHVQDSADLEARVEALVKTSPRAPSDKTSMFGKKIHATDDGSSSVTSFDPAASDLNADGSAKSLDHVAATPKLDPIPQADTDVELSESNALSTFAAKIFGPMLDPFTLEVMSYAVACSSDNIAIYISLFAATTPINVGIIILLFYILSFLNIFIALGLMRVSILVSYHLQLYAYDLI